jgi:hypothetical protein
MYSELRAESSGLRQHEIEHLFFLRLHVHGHLETIGQQGLHHKSHLILRGIPLRSRFNVESIIVDPRWQTKQVTLTKFECESKVGDQSLIRCREEVSVGDVSVSRAQGKARVRRSV